MSKAKVVFIGLSVTSSWGNGHATNYRGLMRALHEDGHDVVFFERDVPWYAEHRDLPQPPWGRTILYDSLDDLRDHSEKIAEADLVVVGSYVPEGVAVGRRVCDTATGVTAFYDIDTPVTLAKLRAGDEEYLSHDLVGRYDLYLSFTGGPILEQLERDHGAARAEAFYCMADPDVYRPQRVAPKWDLGYLGTYSDDRQPTLDRLLLEVARGRPDLAFAVAGPQYPDAIEWPPNVTRFDHLPPERHCAYYNAQRFALNVTRRDMVAAGYSPSVRLFEAAAAGVPVISDRWVGLEEFFEPGSDILIADGSEDVVAYLTEIDEQERPAIGERARQRVLNEHTPQVRAQQLLRLMSEQREVERV
ncbi:MAG TPA: glycosyltransferase [Actinomycetota bacterium]|nr:glycosyltransferase [Actinomycetota bacterium]